MKRSSEGLLFTDRGNDEDMSMKFVQKGIKKFQKGEFQEAEDEFVKAVEFNDISVRGWYYLGLVREELKDPDGASFCFKKAIAAAKMQDPVDEETTRNSLLKLAKIQFNEQQYIAAMGFLRKINHMEYKDNEMQGNVWGMLGEIYDQLKKKEYALFCYRNSQKSGNKKYRKLISAYEKEGIRPDDPEDKNSPNLLKRKADIMFNQQKFQDAIKVYTETLKVNNIKKVLTDAANAEVTMKIAYAYINLQDFNNAKTYLEQARKLYSKAKMKDEIKVIESTLNKINSLMSI